MTHESKEIARRAFLATTTTIPLGVPLIGMTSLLADTPPDVKRSNKWYESAYRRTVIDMHIPDWDPTFLSKFNPEEYANMLVMSRSESVVCYCQSHVGLFNYPTEVGQSLFPEFDARYPAFCDGFGMQVTAHPGAEVLATTTLPWPASGPDRFSSIHSDPPWQVTKNPEIVCNSFGRGQSIYCSSLIENLAILEPTFIGLARKLEQNYHFRATAPACVEVSLFYQPQRNRYRLSLVNFQHDLPNIPVENVEIRLRLKETVKQIVELPSGGTIPYRRDRNETVFQVPRIETLAVFAVLTLDG